MKINYLSDFKVNITLELGGVPIGVPENDFTLEFMTVGSKRYRCQRRGDVWTNCKPLDDAVQCLMDNHGLPCGALRVRYYDYAPDIDMPDGNLLTVTPETLDVELVMGAGDGTDVEASVATDVAAAIARCDAATEEAEGVVGRADELFEQMGEQVDEARRARNDAEDEAAAAAGSASRARESATQARGHADDAATAAQQAASSADAAQRSEVSASSSASAAASSAAQAASVATTTATTVATNVATTIAGGKADKVVRVDKTTDPATAFVIDANKVYEFGERESLEVSLAAYAGDDVPIYAFTFVSAETATSLDIPATWEILGGTLEIEAGFTYEFNISNGLCCYGKFATA